MKSLMIIAVASVVALAACKSSPAEMSGEELGEPEGLSGPKLALDALPIDDLPVRVRGERDAVTAGVRVTVAGVRERGPLLFCVPERAGAQSVLAEGEVSGDRLVRVATDVPCDYELWLEHAGAREQVVEGSGVLYDARLLAVDGRLAVIWSEVRHSGWSRTRDGRVVTRDPDPVLRARARRPDGGWSSTATLVDLDDAAWLAGVDAEQGSATLRFWRDSLHEHHLYTQEGRPESDGLYAASVTLDARGVPTLSEPTRIRDYEMQIAELDRLRPPAP